MDRNKTDEREFSEIAELLPRQEMFAGVKIIAEKCRECGVIDRQKNSDRQDRPWHQALPQIGGGWVARPDPP